MKDLYSSLGIDPGASDEEVVAALESRPDLAAHAAILRADDRRAAYDRTYAALKAIGALRHRLGLDSECSWFLENSPDFAPALRAGLRSSSSAGPSADKTRRAEAAPADPLTNRHSPRPAVRIRPSLVVALIAGGALAVAALKFL
jgi:hypothetical protein